jgi:hypothetical protein
VTSGEGDTQLDAIRDALTAALRDALGAQRATVAADAGRRAHVPPRYAFENRLVADPDDRDGLLAVGGFYETLPTTAPARTVRPAG